MRLMILEFALEGQAPEFVRLLSSSGMPHVQGGRRRINRYASAIGFMVERKKFLRDVMAATRTEKPEITASHWLV